MGAMAIRNSNSARFTSVWSLVLVLLIIAFWRTMAPERSARVVKRLVAQQQAAAQQQAHNSRGILDEQEDQLATIKATIAREQAVLIKMRDEIETLRESRDSMDIDTDPVDGTDGQVDGIGPISVSKKVKKISKEEEQLADEEKEVEEAVVEEKDPYPEDCKLVLAPISAEAGLGLQTEHLWKHLTIAKTLNACIALPPVVAKTTAALRYVPFHEVVDLDALIIEGGIRAVPLAACKARGIKAIYSDDKKIAYLHYVRKADPVLAIESNNLGVDKVRKVKSFRKGKFSEDEGTCIGMGRMKADVPADEGVVAAWKLHPKIADYVHNRYPHLSEDTLFVKLRKVCETEGDICLGNPEKQVVAMQDYVNAVKEQARRMEVQHIYISIPANTREDTLEYLTGALDMVDNVILNLEGDEFAANLVEREIATAAKGFVHDWGIWGDTITKLRKARTPDSDDEVSNADIMQRWTDAGKPDHSAIFAPAEANPQKKKEYVPPPPEQEETEGAADDNVDSNELQDSEKHQIQEG